MSQDTASPFEQVWAQILSVIHQGQRFLIAAHRGPDGDAVGSVLGLYATLKELGKDVVPFNDGPYPERFDFLPNIEMVRSHIDPQEKFDVTILCDCGEISRAPDGFPSREQLGTFIVLDHHLTSGLEGDINLNDPSSPATGLVIFELAQRLGVEITPAIAKSVYCALLSDTGGFRYQKTSPYALRAAAQLLEAGVDPWEISSGLFESNPIARQRLLALCLNTLDLRCGDQLAFLHVTEEMYQQSGGDEQMTDGFVNFGRGIKGVEVSAFLRPQKDGWKVSLRSRGRVNVSGVAANFGGGGHRQAAGTHLQGSLEEVKEAVLNSLLSQF
ncbi:MAG: bifunctional oligoribonuclease/PAP phosphatase NrnA [Myxococcales bacterium]|nr:bifunctional oligoribonuclease/PAP phosphatase NrnA [Myxococcales bacterium]MCB9643088.1 bifunctional oligoribonuclease/PAP phosphatase NrnA [Myxococcales bacterium]